MRSLLWCLVVLASCCPTFAQAQEKKFQPPEIKGYRVGFQTYQKEEQTIFKVGLWAPIYVDVFGGSDGLAPRPGPGGVPYVEIAVSDSEDVKTVVRIPAIVKPFETQTLVGFIKAGHGAGTIDFDLKLRAHNRDFTPRGLDAQWTSGTDTNLYLTLGPRMTDFHRALRKIGRQPGQDKEADNIRDEVNNPHQAVFENDAKKLPEAWFGYNGVDIIILSTENRPFLNQLNNNPRQVRALAQWVRRGGRLIVPVTHERQDVVSELLRNKAWDPPIPVVPPASPGNVADSAVRRLTSVEAFGGVQGDPFKRNDNKTIPIALLDPGNVRSGDWEILAENDADESRPFMTQVRYGLGQITYLAFSFDDPNFIAWPGREQFLRKLAEKLAPNARADMHDPRGGFRNVNMGNADLTTDLLTHLDNFDVKVIEFGYVALFIVLYILVVGPLDFFLLKYVFKRLEWTWITFPTVVLAVSVIAYFAAYALKGRDLKINKIDVVDFDMRTDPKSVHVYGRSFFTILSPRIQNYTIGLEPNPEFWGEKADKTRSADLVEWMGRPSGGPNDMGRSGSSSFFRKPYAFREDYTGLEGVPIPVWTTKAFSASWEQPIPRDRQPFKFDLVFHLKEVRGKDLRITGTLENHLGADLIDTWMIYDNQCYAVPGGIKRTSQGGKAQEISIPGHPSERMSDWVSRNDEKDDAPAEQRGRNLAQVTSVKKILFHEKFDTQGTFPNHALRPLDLGWRMKDLPRDRKTREAILFGRIRNERGNAETMTTSATNPLPTKLWLGDLPDDGKSRPALVGTLNQDTYVRVILSVRAADE